MGNREETELALQKAALDLLRRDGVLAGINLREVADEAGVNRGLLYHYYGSRREILRAALRRDYRSRMQDLRAGSPRGFRRRWAHFFRTIVEHPRAIRIATLLHLDRDPKVRLMPIRDETRGALERDRQAGELGSDVDLDGLHATLNALVYGYALYRDRFARELRRPVRDLDGAVADVLDRLLAAVGDTAPTPPERDRE